MSQPFLTVQKAAGLAKGGDTVFVRAGVYSETITPANSGTSSARITFKSYKEEEAIISGADPVTGWTVHDLSNGRKIYKATMDWTLNSGTGASSAGMDQVFVDGEMMVEARWPNLDPGVNPAAYKREYGSQSEAGKYISTNDPAISEYTDNELSSFSSNFWKDAKIHFIAGYFWTPMTGTVTASTNKTITFTHPYKAGIPYAPREGDYYYLWGKYEALDAPREWFRDNSGTLYLWTSNGDSPANYRVEAKKRQYVFELRDRAYITIENLKIWAGGINTNTNSTNLILESVDIKYAAHYSLISGYWHTRGVGSVLKGANTIVRNSELGYNAETVLLLTGKDSKAVNNVVHDGAYLGCNGYVLAINQASGGQLINNTVFGCGTNALIDFRESAACKILYNDVYGASKITADGGMLMGTRNFDGQNAEIAYNYTHEGYAPSDGSKGHYGVSGIYLEGNVKNYLIHHNVIKGGIALGPGNEGIMDNIRVYNNIMFGQIVTSDTYALSGEIKNNVTAGVYWNLSKHDLKIQNNLTTQKDMSVFDQSNIFLSDPKFLDTNCNDYRPANASPLIDKGQVIQPYTDGFTGTAPDIGAFEKDKPIFIAGALILTKHIKDLTVTYDNTSLYDNTSFPGKKFTVTGMPVGRKLPADFKLKIGSAPAGGTMYYCIKTGVFSFTDVPTGGQNGVQPIYGQIGTGIPVHTGEYIDLGTATTTEELKGIFNLNIYPNPAREEITINYYSSADKEIEIIISDVLSRRIKKEIYQSQTTDNEIKLDVSDLRNGLYFIEVISGDSRAIKEIIILK